jgi:hypothetical protein
MKICFSYSADENYYSYVKNSVNSLITNAPNVHANIDLVDFNQTHLNFVNSNKIKFNYIFPKVPSNKITIKNKGCEALTERTVSLTGAYANLRKVYNIYNLLLTNEYDYVVNMDADNLILKNVEEYITRLPLGFDIHIKYNEGKLQGDDLIRRKGNFKHFNNMEVESIDKHFREGCMVVSNTDNARKFFKLVAENILSKIVWYGDSYWITYAYSLMKDEIKINRLPEDFVIYDLNETNVNTAYVCSGYGMNKHSSLYKQLIVHE